MNQKVKLSKSSNTHNQINLREIENAWLINQLDKKREISDDASIEIARSSTGSYAMNSNAIVDFKLT